jgi:hypothetical protein
MNDQRNEKRIDELISRAINTEKPQFNVEEWKQKYPDEYQALLSRRVKADSTSRQKILKVILKSSPTKIVAAAVIILAVSFIITQQASDEQEQQRIEVVKKSPVEMMTAISLERAFRQGGMEAVEEQCKQAFKSTRPRPRSLPVEWILAEFNANDRSSERTRP